MENTNGNVNIAMDNLRRDLGSSSHSSHSSSSGKGKVSFDCIFLLISVTCAYH